PDRLGHAEPEALPVRRGGGIDLAQMRRATRPRQCMQRTAGPQSQRIGARIAGPVEDATPELGGVVEPLSQKPTEHGGEGRTQLVAGARLGEEMVGDDAARHHYSAACGRSAGGSHLSLGDRAARVSSRRRRGAFMGAAVKRSLCPDRAAAARSSITSQKRSRLCLLSLSVGSTSIAPCTTSGKYMVIGW